MFQRLIINSFNTKQLQNQSKENNLIQRNKIEIRALKVTEIIKNNPLDMFNNETETPEEKNY